MFLLRSYKPYSPGIRHKKSRHYIEFLNSQKHFFFFKSKKNCSGRNNSGKITIRHRGVLVKKKKILWQDKLRLTINLLSLLIGVYKQKNNMCFFGLIKYSSGIFSYIYLAHGLKIGMFLYSNSFFSKKFYFPLGSVYFFVLYQFYFRFFNVCSFFKKKSIYARSAGVFCKFLSKNEERNFMKIELPSGQIKFLPLEYNCTIGRASNIFAYKDIRGKAGLTRRLGFRPSVRGVAMNPVDHPNGGRTKTNKPEKTPWGRIAKYSK